MARTKLRFLIAVITVLTLTFGLVGQALAASNDNTQGPPGRKIVVFDSGVVNEAAQQTIIERTGATPLKPLPLVNAWVALASPANEHALRAVPGVLRVEDDGQVSIVAPPSGIGGGKPPPPPPPAETLPWGVDRIDAELVWETYTGSGIKVAIMDTGIDLKHSDLKVYGWVNTINSGKSANDDNGHGTHVAGTVAALDNEIGVIGVAPNASLYAVKVLDRNGSGWWSDVIEGLQWSIANGMQVVNMSFGASSAPASVGDAIKQAYAAGIVLVAAAGNSGPGDNTVIYPAAYAEVIAVSATNSSDTLASWSSRGAEVELAAPGVSIYSTWKGNSYNTISGTSMASPHVAGTAVLVIASGVVSNTDGVYGIANEVRAKLQTTADDLGTTDKDNLYGYGLVDAQEAATGIQTLP